MPPDLYKRWHYSMKIRISIVIYNYYKMFLLQNDVFVLSPYL